MSASSKSSCSGPLILLGSSTDKDSPTSGTCIERRVISDGLHITEIVIIWCKGYLHDYGTVKPNKQM